MDTAMDHFEVFRRSSLTLFLDALLAFGMVAAFTWFYLGHALSEDWLIFFMAVLSPLIWAGAQVFRWYHQTWTVTSEGLLIIRNGISCRSREAIHLCSAREVRLHSNFVMRWLGIGHVSFRATDAQGQLRQFQWKWVRKCHRLEIILNARGRASLQAYLPWKKRLERFLRDRRAAWKMQPGKRDKVSAAECTSTKLSTLDNYNLFLGFCGELLHHQNGGQYPYKVPLVIARRWLQILEGANVIDRAPETRYWEFGGDVHCIRDIRRTIDQKSFQKFVCGIRDDDEQVIDPTPN